MSETYNVNALPPGAMLQEYRLDRVIGAGSFGIIYLAENTYLPQMVAIKEFLPSELAQRVAGSRVSPKSSETEETYQWARGKFLKEARIIWELGQPNPHPNIVRVTRFFEENGTAYMVMDFEEGESLAHKLEQGTIPEDELRELLFPLLDGLQRVHERSVWHRDIKPANILIRRDGAPVLLDFGAARHEVAGQAASIMDVYTPDYAAPEQVYSTADIGPWTDIYALGATLYHAVIGKPPVSATQRALGAEHTRAVEAAGNDYSYTFLEAIDAAIELKPEDRPQNVVQWRQRFEGKFDLLANVEDDKTVIRPRGGAAGTGPPAVPDEADTVSPHRSNLEHSAHPRPERAGAAQRRESAPRRRGGRIAALGVLILLALGAGGIAYWTDRRPPPVTEVLLPPATEALASAGETNAPQRESTVTVDETRSSAQATVLTDTPVPEPPGGPEAASTEAPTSSVIAEPSPPTAKETPTGTRPPKVPHPWPVPMTEEVGVTEIVRVLMPMGDPVKVPPAAATQSAAPPVAAPPPLETPPPETPRDEVGEMLRQLSPPVEPEQVALATPPLATPPLATPPLETPRDEVGEVLRQLTPPVEPEQVALATPPLETPPLETPRDEVGEVLRQLSPPVEPEQVALARLAPPRPEQTLREAHQLIREVECAALRAELTDDSQILLSGYARSRSELDGLVNQLALLEHVNGVLKKVKIYGRPFCEVLQILNADASLDARAGAPPRIEPDKAARVYLEGELLQLTARPTSEFDGYLYVDYIDGEGNVLHLLPAPHRTENWFTAGEKILLGRDRQYKIAPPHGQSMLIAISTRARLFEAVRPEIETVTDYLPVLRRRLREVERGGESAGTTSSYTVIKTRAQAATTAANSPAAEAFDGSIQRARE